MDKKASNKMQRAVSKGKNKQVKDELDRIKQAEKKKRRLEKALATSAAICSELENKKQKKKEEQQRLDEEGAAIAEAVALSVLLGEDSDDPAKIMLHKEEGYNLFMGGGRVYRQQARPNCEGWVTNAYRAGCEGWVTNAYRAGCEGWITNAYRAGCEWAEFGNSDFSFFYGAYGRDIQAPFFENGGLGSAGLSVGLIAAQAVSALRITEDAKVI